VERYIHTNDAGTFTASPTPQEAPPEETVELSDGTEATLRYMEHTMEGGNYGPLWEGSFEKQEYYYTLPDHSGEGVWSGCFDVSLGSTDPCLPLSNPTTARLCLPRKSPDLIVSIN
jgi:hypothetical protein